MLAQRNELLLNMAFEVNIEVLSESRNRAFQSDQKSIEEKVFSFPELLQPAMFSNATPVPTEVFDLSQSLTISNRHTEAILSGLSEIDSLTGIDSSLQWLLSESVVIAKAMNKEFYTAVASLANKINEIINSSISNFHSADCEHWSATLRTIRRFQFQFNLAGIPSDLLQALVKEKHKEDNFWLLMIELSFHFEEALFIKEVIGRDWLNNYYLDLKAKFENISELIFLDNEKLLNADISAEDFNLDRYKENKEQIQGHLQNLNTVFREFEFIKKHPVYNGILGKFLPAYESLKSLDG